MRKVRTQVQLEPEQYQALQDLARRQRCSFSEALRRLLNAQLSAAITPEQRMQQAMKFVGQGRDSHEDVSERHDDYLAGLEG